MRITKQNRMSLALPYKRVLLYMYYPKNVRIKDGGMIYLSDVIVLRCKTDGWTNILTNIVA